MHVSLLSRPALKDVQPRCVLPQETDERAEVANHANYVIRPDADQLPHVNLKSACWWFNQRVERGDADRRGGARDHRQFARSRIDHGFRSP
jgi:hypothetical protein